MSAKASLTAFTRGFAAYARALRLVWLASPRYAFLALFTTFFTALMPTVQVWISREMINQVSDRLRRGAFTASYWQDLLLPISLFLIVWIIGGFFQSVSFSVNEMITRKVHYYAKDIVLKKAASLSLAFYETPTYFDQLELARREIWRFYNVAYFAFSILTQTITVVSLLFLLGQVNPAFPFALILTTLPRLISQSYFMTQRAKLVMRSAPAERMADYLSLLMTTREPVKEIRLFQLQDYLLKGFRTFAERYVTSIGEVVVPQGRISFLLSLLSLTGTAGIWGYAIYQAGLGIISLGDIALIFQATERCRTTLDPLFDDFGYIFENVFYLNNFFNFLDLPPDSVAGALTHPPSDRSDLPSDTVNQHWTITFRHVTFRYPGAERPALQDLSFTLHPGETIALVGENGAGKTTLVKLLARLYDPTEGQILLNGHDLRTYDPVEYYRQVGVIFQDYNHYDLSARENVGFGRIEAVEALEQVRQAAEMGGALGLIEKLPNGFETMLGKRFEETGSSSNNIDLSGGEWQKIALARAFMRMGKEGNVALLILDEPTAALDAYSESEVYNRFSELTQGKSTVFVTHRLSSVKMAHKILVLKEGHLLEEGSHDELLAKDGEYAKMFLLQAERYQAAPSVG